MEALFWILGGVLLVLWVVFSWGKSVGLDEGRRAEQKVKTDAGREMRRLEEKLERTTKTLTLENATLEAALTQVRQHRDALRPAGSLLADIRSYTPSWLDGDPFLLLGPGQLREYQAWATRAQGLWLQIDRLSGPARLALEQAYNANVDQSVLPAPVVPLVKDVIAVADSRPRDLGNHNLFNLRSDDFQHLAEWFGHLSKIAAGYIARVAQIEDSERRRQQNAKTRESLHPSSNREKL